MNAQCYRVIFNKARGMLMVVSESARSQGKTSNPTEGGSAISQVAGGSQTSTQVSAGSSYQGGKLMTLRSHLLLALGLATIVATSAHADSTNIVADRNAAANQQAVIINTSSGKTQVNIQTPSAAGVSRNVFSKFDVGQDGAILNNSRTNAQTQLAGWVEGNPYLARGEARVILNEVNSSDPSRLSGFTEIAGGRAELIIANPAGITCAGCGFINAARTTLTTGNALMDQGRVTGFDISKGNIRVDGDGLDTSGSDYTQILAKTTEINAAVYANNLDVITGSNRVSYEADGADSIITPKSATGSNQATGVALDVSALGAMYAGKIRLIGTEKGMGVTNAGSIIASSGGLQLDNDGNLINSGSLVANQGKVDITTSGKVDNSGTIASSRAGIDINSATLANSGVVSSYDKTQAITQQRITNTGTISSGQLQLKTIDLDNRGLIEQTGSGSLAVKTQKLINNDQAVIGQALYDNQPTTTAPTVNSAPSTANTGSQNQVVDNASPSNPTPSPDAPSIPSLTPVTASGSITANALTNATSNAVITANGNTVVQANDISNTAKSSIAVDKIITNNQQAGNRLNNDNSRIQITGADWKLEQFSNNKGQIVSQQNFNIDSQQGVDNTAGTLASQKDITLITQGNVNNSKGVIQAQGVAVQGNQLDNTEGKLYAENAANLTIDGKANNTQGAINAKQDIKIATGSLISQDRGLIRSGKALDITVKDRLENLDNSLIAAGTHVDIKANNISQDATSKTIAGLDQQGALSTDEYDLTISTESTQDNQGQNIATGNLAMVGSDLKLNSATLQANDIQLTAKDNSVNLQDSKVYADGNFDLKAAQDARLNNGEISAKQIDILASNIDNTAGNLYADSIINLNQTKSGGTLLNASGKIASKDALNITFDTVNNTGKDALLLSDKTINIKALQVNNNNQLVDKKFTGGIQAQDITIAAQKLDNTEGYINSDNSNLIIAKDLKNTKGYIYGGTDLNIGTPAQTLKLNNNQGELRSKQNINIVADSVTNTKGLIASQGNAAIKAKQGYLHQAGDNLLVNKQLSIQTLGNIDNQSDLKAGEKLVLQANNVTNDIGAQIVSNDVDIQATKTLHNKGLINANDLRLQAEYLDNDSAKIYGTTVLIKANTINNQGHRSSDKGAIIASRGDMTLIADTINNQSGNVTYSKAQDNAWILSNGNLTIGGATDDKGGVTANAKAVNNISGRIEAFNDMSITADKLLNKNASFKTEIQDVEGSDTQKIFIIPGGTANKIPLDKLRWVNWSRAGLYKYASDTDNEIENGQLGQAPIPNATSCSNGDNSVCTLNYDNDSEVWAYFNLTPPTLEAPQTPTITEPTEPVGQESCSDPASAACSAYNDAYKQYEQQQKEYDQAWQDYNAKADAWEEQDSEKYEALDNAIRAYNAGYGRIEIKKWTQIIVNERQRQSVVTDSSPAQIIAGGDMTLDIDNVVNDKSQILAGGLIDFDKTTENFEQIDGDGKLLVVQNGTSQYTKSRWRGGFKRYHQRDWNDKQAYTDIQETTIKLPVSQWQQNADLSLQGQQAPNVDNQIKDGGPALSNLQKGDGPTNNTAINVATSPSGDEIRSVNGATTLPNNSLYNINPDKQNDYLIESDPAFTGYRNWLTSDYMLQRLKLDPNITQKRLGDGYYEQQYIRDQIMMLTGRYYLQDYSTQDAQYQGLMDAGVTTAQTLNLRPGIALTASQVANLTSDIIWMEQQQVTLADGSTQSVLVPKVYVRANQGAIRGDGSFIAAERVNLSLTGNLDNQGLISAQKTLNINADNINNTNGGRLRAADARLTAENKITNVGGSIFADNTLGLKAKSVENISTTFTTNNQLGASSATRTGIDQVASIGVGDGLRGQVDANGKALTTLAINATNDVTFNAGILNNQGGNTQIVSKEGNVAFNVINTGNEIRAIGDANNYYIDGQSQDIGSRVSSYGDLDIAAKNVSGTAATLTSDSGNTSIYAKNDVTFKEGRATSEFSTANKMTSRGFLSKKTTQERFETQSDSAITSNIEGNQVAIQAGNNISLTGTNAISDKGTSLTAGGDIDILAAQNTSSENTYSQTKKSGLFGASGGLGFTIGKQQTDDSNAKTALTHTASKVGAIDGNVIIDAGRNYQQTGSNIVAGMGADSNKDITDPDRGNTVIRAQNIDIDNVMDVYTNQSEQKFKQSGLTVSVSNSLVDNAKSIDRLVDAGGDTDSMRMKGMAGVAAVLKTKALAKEATNAAKGMAGGINANSLKGAGNTRIQATIGSQKSQSNSSSYTEKNQGSSINTNNLALSATGAGSDSNIDINGSYLTVSNDALFQADNDFNVSGVAQNSNTRNTNKSSSAAIGGYASTGSGVGITASASRGKGYANSDSVTYANSNIKVGNTTTLDIGNDVNIRGGVINTNKAQGQILGDVNIESLQDTATYDSKQKNMGFSADIDIAGGGAGSSLFVNGGKTNLNSDYKAVGEQSGIFTGDGGFDIAAGGKTTLIGGAITTTEAARDAGRNRYTSADGIKTQDINNTTSYDGDAIQVGVSLGQTDNKPQASMNGLGYGTDSDSDSSVTRAGITGIAGSQDITTDNRAEYAGILENSFDAGRVNEELGAQTQITQEFGKEAPKAVAEFAEKKMEAYETAQKAVNMLREDLEATKNPEKIVYISDQLRLAEQQLKENETDYQNWKEGGKYRVATHALVLGGLGTGSIEGVLTTGGVAAAAPTISNVEAKMRDALVAQGMDADTASNATKGITSLALAGAGVAAGLNTSSTVTAVNVDANNRQLHPEEAVLIEQLAQDYAQKNGISITEAEKRLTRGALYNIDVGWQNSINNYIDAQEIQTYQQAYNYLTNQTRDISVYDLSNQISLANQPVPEVSDPTLPSAVLDTITVTASENAVLGFEGQREDYYLDTAANGFTATKEDFNNQTLFMNTAYADEQTAVLYDKSANMKFGTDISAKEAAMMYGANNVANIAGLISGANKAIDNNVETIKAEANKSAKDHLNDAITVSKNIVETVKGATSNVVNDPNGTWDSAVDKAGQSQEGALTEWNYRKLKRQQVLPYDVTYKDAQMVGGLGADAMMGGAAGRGVKFTKEGLDQLGKVNIDVTPKPATVVGTSDTGGATTITGKPNGSKNGIGAAETGGAILAIGDAKEGAYTNNSGDSITGPGGGNATSTGKRDDNGNEIYQRDSGGYYYIDDNGIQRTAASPYENNSNIGAQKLYHDAKVTEYKSELEARGYTVSDKEASFGYDCGKEGLCRPDIIGRGPDGKIVLFEVKTGNANLSIRQSEIYPQIRNGEAIPRGDVADNFGLTPGLSLKEQGYPNGIPIEIIQFEGLKND